MVRRALAVAAEALRTDERAQACHRLEQLEVEIERAVDLAVRTGSVPAVARKLEFLEAERRELEARLAAAPARLPDLAELRPLIEARVGDFRAAFEGERLTMRRGLRALLGDRRLAVSPSPERGFRVEGLLALPLMRETPGVSEDRGRFQRVVAGGRYARVSPLPGPLVLPVEGAMSREA